MAPEHVETAEREARLDQILADYLDAVEAGTAPSRDALLSRHPDLAEDLRAFFRDEDQFGSLVAPLRAPHTPGGVGPPSTSGPEAPAAPAAAGRVVGDYELLEELARGGMGVVYRARQRSVHRVVALKMILAGEFASPEAVQRFRLEAEAAAALDHPHIVPLFEVGEHDGQPFFSMKLIEGGNLGQHMARLGRDPRAAARLVAQVARAVHYAHQHGILHRDLKPANILLDAEDRPHITDFGLAKRFAGRSHPSGFAALSLTASGAAVGTPGYMAPEQAAGPSSRLTTAVDVYALGAILYELLTGRPPFRGATPLETVLAVLADEPAPPRQLNPGLPRDLETVCLKCLRKEPGQRYASAAALADDLERFLAGDTVQARRVGRLERLGRWCRRNPAAALSAALTAAALVAVAVVCGLYALAESRHAAHLAALQQQAEQAAAEARHQAELADEQRARAEDAFRQAHQAVNDCVQASEELARHPGLQPLCKDLLTGALRYYRHFVEQRGDDPRLVADLADACTRVGRITATIGPKSDALAAHRQALPLYRRLAQAQPDEPRWQTAVAETLNQIAILGLATGRPAADCRADAQEALALCDRLAHARPDALERLDLLAGTYHLLAGLEDADGHTEAALARYAQARSLWQQLACIQPGGKHYPGELALCISNTGVLYARLERDDEAVRCLEEARAVREKVAEESPRDAGALIALAASYRDLGVTYARLRRGGDALHYYRRARDLRARLARENPAVVLYQSDLAASLGDLGRASLVQKKFAEALDYFQQALAVNRKLMDLDPSVAAYRREVAKNHALCGDMLSANRQLADAVAAYGRARELQEEVVRTAPRDSGARGELAHTLNNLGLTLARLGRYDDALAALRGAAEQARAAAEQAPNLQEYRRVWATCCGALAEVARAAGRPEDSAAALLDRRRLCADNPQELYRVARELALTAAAVGRGQLNLPAAEAARRDHWAAEAVATLRQAIGQGYRDAERLRQDSALQALRGRGDFEDLLKGLQRAPAESSAR